MCYLLFIANFFLGSCSTTSVHPTRDLSSKEINNIVTEEDRKWMEKFFREFFLKSGSIYTLFGSKPISEEVLVYSTEKDHKKWLLSCIEKFEIEGEEKEKILSEGLKSFRENDFEKNWEKWIAFIQRYPNSPFLFAKHPTLSDKAWSAHILNIQETVWTLQKNYNIFKKQLGFDFDPVTATMDFKNEDSAFWKQVFSNHLLTGIVYGYGYKNSYLFNLYRQIPKESQGKYPLFSSLTIKREPDNKNLTVKNIILPKFYSFGLSFNKDPVLEKYRLERTEIKKSLNESNFFEATFFQLIGKAKENSN